MGDRDRERWGVTRQTKTKEKKNNTHNKSHPTGGGGGRVAAAPLLHAAASPQDQLRLTCMAHQSTIVNFTHGSGCSKALHPPPFTQMTHWWVCCVSSSRCSPHSSAGEGPGLQTERTERTHWTHKETVYMMEDLDGFYLWKLHVLTLDTASKITSSLFSSWAKTETFRWTIPVETPEERKVPKKICYIANC